MTTRCRSAPHFSGSSWRRASKNNAPRQAAGRRVAGRVAASLELVLLAVRVVGKPVEAVRRPIAVIVPARAAERHVRVVGLRIMAIPDSVTVAVASAAARLRPSAALQ